MSRTVMTGKSRPQGMLVAGLVEAGPEVPMQPPTTFGQMTKYRSVSIGLPAPDHGLPPARLSGHGVIVDDMLIAGQRMTDQNRIAARGIERAVGLIGDLQRRKINASVEPQRLVKAKAHDWRMRVIRFAGAVGKVKCCADIGHFCFPNNAGSGAASQREPVKPA